MNKNKAGYLVIIMLIFTLTNCDIIFNNISDLVHLSALTGHSLYYADYSGIKTYRDIGIYLENNITYKKDDIFDKVASPEETLKRGYGDCDEYTLVFMNIAYIVFGDKFDLIITFYDKKIVEGGITNHATISLNGQAYNVYSGRVDNTCTVKYIYSFDQIFTKR